MNQIKSGAVLSYMGLVVTILIALLYTPIMIRLLGQAEYGLFALIGSFAAYFSIMDMGLTNAVVRYTARNRAIGDKLKESKLNGMFLILFSIIGLLVIILGILLLNSIENIFGNSLSTQELFKAKIMIIILIFNFSISFPLAVFGAIMQAHERFINVKVIAIIRSISVPLLTLPLLFLGFQSIAMILVITTVNISCLLYNVWYCFKKLDIKFHFGKIDEKLLKEILGYSFFVFLGVIVDQIYWNTDQFILGVFAGTVPVAVYAIAMQFVTLYMRFSTSISGLFLPKVSMMIANKESTSKLTQMMIKYGRLQFVVLAFILSGFVLFGEDFIVLWAGNEYINSYKIILIIMIPLTIPLIQNIGISILYAKNLQKFRSLNLIVIAILNIVITIPLVQELGGLGAAIATAISLSLGNIVIMNIYYNFKIGINIIQFWKSIFKLFIPVVVSLMIGYGMNYLIDNDNLYYLVAKIFVFTAILFTIMWVFGFNKDEKKLFKSLIKSMKNIIVIFFKKLVPN